MIDTDIQQIKINNLKRIMMDCGLDPTPTNLAQIMGVSIQHASALLNGTSNMGNATIKKLAAFFNVPETKFYRIDDQSPVKSKKDLSEEVIKLLKENYRLSQKLREKPEE